MEGTLRLNRGGSHGAQGLGLLGACLQCRCEPQVGLGRAAFRA